MAKSKLNTDLDTSAKKIKTKKPSKKEDLKKTKKVPAKKAVKEEKIHNEEQDPAIEPEFTTPEEGEGEDDGATYTMGEILASDHDDGEEPLKTPAQPDATEDDEDGEWVDEEVNLKDEDPYLDMEDFDLDNPEDDNY